MKGIHGVSIVEVEPPKMPTPEDILRACAKLQKAGADLSEMTIVYDQSDMSVFWIVSRKDLKRNATI